MHKLVKEIAEAVAQTPNAEARAIVVGGYVRDQLLGNASKDVDVEVFGLEIEALKGLLQKYGEVIEIGRAFGVLRIKGLDVDFSLPREDSKVGRGHRGFDVQTNPRLSFKQAARRRDLTVNSIGYDPLTGAYLDPFGGREDLANKRLRATDAAQFSEDPLRAVRVAQFAARLQMRPDAELITLCRRLDLSEVSPERLYCEFEKLLVKGIRPSLGFEFLNDSGLISHFPEVACLMGVEQDPDWHPEGDVWVHTLMVLDEAASIRGDQYRDPHALMFGALCHDFGKPVTTRRVDGRVRSLAHEAQGIQPTREFLSRLRAPNNLVDKTAMLVKHHLAPAMYVQNGAGAKAYRRLARNLESVDLSLRVLTDVATADHFGRTTEQARRREFPALRRFQEQAQRFLADGKAPVDLVSGKDLIARGMLPGKDFGRVLSICRDLQDDRDWSSASSLIDEAIRRFEESER